MNKDRDSEFNEWCILELMGHRRVGGEVSEAEIGGVPFVRIDVPANPPFTQYYGKTAIYCITPTTEEIARAIGNSAAGPVQRYELPASDAALEDERLGLARTVMEEV